MVASTDALDKDVARWRAAMADARAKLRAASAYRNAIAGHGSNDEYRAARILETYWAIEVNVIDRAFQEGYDYLLWKLSR